MYFRPALNLRRRARNRKAVLSHLGPDSRSARHPGFPAWPVGILAVCCACILLTLPIGCSYDNYARFSPAPQVARTFAAGEWDPDLAYYASGFNTYTWALLGLLPEYRIESEHWKAVEPQSSEFKAMVARIGGAHGALIRTAEGVRIGVWCARQPQTVLKLEPDGRVTARLLNPPMRGR